jgi:septation ring formation regulator EzrA
VDSLSDARQEHLPGLVKEFEKITELPPELHATIDTDLDFEENLRKVLAKGYAMRRFQVERAMERL